MPQEEKKGDLIDVGEEEGAEIKLDENNEPIKDVEEKKEEEKIEVEEVAQPEDAAEAVLEFIIKQANEE